MVSDFKGFIAVVIILLFTQQSFAAYMPMNCDDMKNTSIVSSDKESHLTSKVTMKDHESLSKVKMSSHEECNVCNSGECICGEMGGCSGSTISTSAQAKEQSYTLFVDHGNRFISQDEYPDSGVHLQPFRPPIHI